MHKLRNLLDTGAALPPLLTFESHQRPPCHGYVDPRDIFGEGRGREEGESHYRDRAIYPS
jgi:hypothetical protein